MIAWLFETKAIKVSEHDNPFWYTSGTIGPYYINTHFLYGGENKANELLKLIDDNKNDVLEGPKKIFDATFKNYNEDKIFKNVIDELCSYIIKNIDINEIDFISGGERRDWFFSYMAAKLLNKPHVTIYKNMETVIYSDTQVYKTENLEGKNVLHIADLITEASSYERAWIPAIKKLNGLLKWSVVIVDRMQGGAEILEKNSIKSFAMVQIDTVLFEGARYLGLISPLQYDMIEKYIKNPKEAMRRFLKDNSDFIKKSLQGDQKTKERVNLCMEKDIYQLKG